MYVEGVGGEGQEVCNMGIRWGGGVFSGGCKRAHVSLVGSRYGVRGREIGGAKMVRQCQPCRRRHHSISAHSGVRG